MQAQISAGYLFGNGNLFSEGLSRALLNPIKGIVIEPVLQLWRGHIESAA